MAAIALYFPPQPRHARLVPHYKETVRMLTQCTPLVYADLNDGTGISRIAGQWQHVESQSMGPGRAREQRRGGAGENMRMVNERRHLNMMIVARR
eukprot:2240174-Pyramimonas_sp.AAC.1